MTEMRTTGGRRWRFGEILVGTGGEDRRPRRVPTRQPRSSGLGFEATSRHVQMPSTRVLDLRDGVEASRATWDKDTRQPRPACRRARGSRSSASVPTTTATTVAGAARADGGRRVAQQLLRAPFAGSSSSTYGQERRRPGVHLSRPTGKAGSSRAHSWDPVGDRAYYQFAGSLREPELRHANAAYGVMDRVIAECVDARGAQSRPVRRQREGSSRPRTLGGRA